MEQFRASPPDGGWFVIPAAFLKRGAHWKLAFYLVFASLLSSFAYAEDSILEVRNARIGNGSGFIDFSRADLEALPQATIETSNDFIDGASVFRGPRAADVIDRVGRAGSIAVRLIAKNEYAIEISLDEIKMYQPILALEMDGKPLSVRDKGPIWLIYPMNDYPELKDPAYNGRLIWQLEMIELL